MCGKQLLSLSRVRVCEKSISKKNSDGSGGRVAWPLCRRVRHSDVRGANINVTTRPPIKHTRAHARRSALTFFRAIRLPSTTDISMVVRVLWVRGRPGEGDSSWIPDPLHPPPLFPLSGDERQ